MRGCITVCARPVPAYGVRSYGVGGRLESERLPGSSGKGAACRHVFFYMLTCDFLACCTPNMHVQKKFHVNMKVTMSTCKSHVNMQHLFLMGAGRQCLEPRLDGDRWSSPARDGAHLGDVRSRGRVAGRACDLYCEVSSRSAESDMRGRLVWCCVRWLFPGCFSGGSLGPWTPST